MHRQLTILFAAAALAAAPHCATAQEPVDLAMIARIRAEGLEKSRVLETFNHFTNVIGPRLTGSPAHKQAAEYAKAQLAAAGASNARLEPFPFGRGWTLEKFTFEMTAPRYLPLVGFPYAWTPATRGVITGTPVYIGDKTAAEVEAMGEKLRGAIVLVQRPETVFVRKDRIQPATSDSAVRSGAPPMPRADAATPLNTAEPILRRFGAAATLRPGQGEHGTMFVLGNQRTTNDATPAVIVEAEQYNMLVRGLQSGAPVQLRLELGVRYHTSDTNTYNVVAEIPGEDPALRNEVVLLGAHLDSWHSSTGATDNADAVSSLIEAMRILKAVGAHPRRTIRVAFWSGEEEGLLGSGAYVNRHYAGDSNAAARDALSVYLNDDSGEGATYGFYMENNAAAKSIFDAWLEPLRDLGMKKNVIGAIGNTDHLSFTRLGLPGFSTIKDYVGYDTRTHHTNADFYERLNEPDLKQSAIVMAVFAYHAAMRAEKIPKAPAAPR
jgi:carboxypeptidase Q